MKSLFDDNFLLECGADRHLKTALTKIKEHALEEIKAGRGCDRAGQTCIVPNLPQTSMDEGMKIQVIKMCDFMRFFGKCAHLLYLERHTPEHASFVRQSMFSIR